MKQPSIRRLVAVIVGVLLLACMGCGSKAKSPPPESFGEPPLQEVAELPGVIESPRSDHEHEHATETATEPQPDDPLQLQDDALTALETGDSGEALRLIRRAIAVTPDDPATIFVMARILAERNRFAEAIRMLDELAEAVPETRLPALGQSAQWLVFEGRWREAEESYRRLLAELSGDDARMVDRMLAQLLLRQGRRLEAMTHLRELCRSGDVTEFELRSLLIALHPLPSESLEDDEWKPIGALGRARYEISQGNWKAALAELAESQPEGPAEAALRGRLYAQQQTFELLDAWAAETVRPQQQQAADHWFAMGVHEAHRENDVTAVKHFCQAVLLDATDFRAYLMMSQSLARLGFQTEAEAAAQRAKLIERTQTLGNELAETNEGRIENTSALIDLLKQLRRPYEAIAWQGVLVFYRQSDGALSEAEAVEAMTEINRKRLELASENELEATQAFLLCGVDLDSLPQDADRK